MKIIIIVSLAVFYNFSLSGMQLLFEALENAERPTDSIHELACKYVLDRSVMRHLAQNYKPMDLLKIPEFFDPIDKRNNKHLHTTLLFLHEDILDQIITPVIHPSGCNTVKGFLYECTNSPKEAAYLISAATLSKSNGTTSQEFIKKFITQLEQAQLDLLLKEKVLDPLIDDLQSH